MIIEPLYPHYSMESQGTIYDEEATTALKLAGRTASKVNECVTAVNTIPEKIAKDVKAHIENGEFDRQIDEHEKAWEAKVDQVGKTYGAQVADLTRTVNARLDALLGSVVNGSTTRDAEVIDLRTSAGGNTFASAGEAIRNTNLCADFGTIEAGNYMEKCPSINEIYRPCVLRFNFYEGTTAIPDGFPWKAWKGGFATLITTNTNTKGSNYYCTQILFNTQNVFYRFCGASWSGSKWYSVGGGAQKTLITKDNYGELMPNLDILEEGTTRFLFEEGSSDIPEGFPFDKWEGSLATLLTTASLDSNSVYYSTQVLFTDKNIYYRLAGNSFRPWVCLTQNANVNGGEETTLYTSSSILEGVKECYGRGIKRLVVRAGTYDIIEEYKVHYGADYFDKYAGYQTADYFDRGIWLENIEVVFCPGAKVVCHYTGENTHVVDSFSPFACGNNATIDGLELESSRTRYGIHPDYNTGTDLTKMVIRNCILSHEKNEDNHQAIGAGLGIHVDWLFENCYFKTTKELPTMRIHNHASAEAKSRVCIRNCYVDGPGYFLFQHYGESTEKTVINVSACSFKTLPVVGFEADATIENIEYLQSVVARRSS